MRVRWAIGGFILVAASMAHAQTAPQSGGEKVVRRMAVETAPSPVIPVGVPVSIKDQVTPIAVVTRDAPVVALDQSEADTGFPKAPTDEDSNTSPCCQPTEKPHPDPPHVLAEVSAQQAALKAQESYAVAPLEVSLVILLAVGLWISFRRRRPKLEIQFPIVRPATPTEVPPVETPLPLFRPEIVALNPSEPRKLECVE